MALISIVTPCYNEEDNVAELYRQVKEVFAKIPQHRYEHIFIDNASKDRTVEILKGLASQDSNVKIIVNVRNFGHIRSPFYGLLQAKGDAVILLVADLQDPPTMILDFISEWEKGYKVVLGIKDEAEESPVMFRIRRAYYGMLTRLADIDLVKNNTGFGLYDQRVIEIFRGLNDPYPYLRGLISEIGFESAKIPYKQPRRRRGITKNNFYTLYDMAMLGFTSHSKVPLRLATMAGFAFSALILLIAFAYLVAKLLFWDVFVAGTAPILIGVFVFSSIQLFFIGLLGEYVLSIHTQILKRPLVTEKMRIGF